MSSIANLFHQFNILKAKIMQDLNEINTFHQLTLVPNLEILEDNFELANLLLYFEHLSTAGKFINKFRIYFDELSALNYSLSNRLKYFPALAELDEAYYQLNNKQADYKTLVKKLGNQTLFDKYLHIMHIFNELNTVDKKLMIIAENFSENIMEIAELINSDEQSDFRKNKLYPALAHNKALSQFMKPWLTSSGDDDLLALLATAFKSFNNAELVAQPDTTPAPSLRL